MKQASIVASEQSKVNYRRDEHNDLLRRWQEFYDKPQRNLVALAYKLGATQTQVAEALDIEVAAVSRKYNKKDFV